MVESDYKKVSLEDRKAESKTMLSKFPDRLPIITERANNSTLPSLEKKKYLIPNDTLVSHFYGVIRKRLNLNSSTSMFVFFGSKHNIVSISTPMAQVYEQYKDEDGFLYCYYTGENTFGQ